MTSDRQERVEFAVSGHLVKFGATSKAENSIVGHVLGQPFVGIEMSDGVTLLMQPSRHSARLVRRLREAKRKCCGKFRLVLQFPVKEFMIGSVKGK